MPRFDRDQVRKGMYMQGAPCEGHFVAKRQPLSPEFEHFTEAASVADRLGEFEREHGAAVAEIKRRLDGVRAQLDAVKARK